MVVNVSSYHFCPLLGWSYLHSEVMNGGYIQLIYNGYGAFIFKNPFGPANAQLGPYRIVFAPPSHQKSIRQVSQPDRKRNVGRRLYGTLTNKMPEFDDADDDFIVNEEQWTKMIAAYIDDHINNFATIEK